MEKNIPLEILKAFTIELMIIPEEKQKHHHKYKEEYNAERWVQLILLQKIKGMYECKATKFLKRL